MSEVNVSLVATLGGQPQVVTFTLDLLLARGEPVEQVIVVSLGGDQRYRQSYQRLAQEFQGDVYRGKPCRLRLVDVGRNGHSLARLQTPDEVETARSTVFSLFAELKQRGNRLHLSLSGGRRVLSLIALAAAMQYLTPVDRVWHIYTPSEIAQQARDGRVMHVPPEAGVSLIEVPFVPWTAYFPGLRPVLGLSGAEALNPRLTWLPEETRRACRALWQELTPRERDVLRTVAAGLPRKVAAEQLSITTSTLDSHMKHILQKARALWNEREISRELLRERFAVFLERQRHDTV